MSDELKVLQPGQEIDLNINGELKKVEVKPFKTGQLLKVIKPVSELATIFKNSDGNVLDLVTYGGDKVVDLVCMVTNLKRSEFEDLELDQAIELIAAIISENKDFFEKKVTPAIEKFTKSITTNKQNSGEASTQD